jgi:hypothetical protein
MKLISFILLALSFLLMGCFSSASKKETLTEKDQPISNEETIVQKDQPSPEIQKSPTTAPVANSSNKKAPVQVFIMMGQSNMVGFGKIDGRSQRLGEKEISNPIAYLYEGDYDPNENYEELMPREKKVLAHFGGKKPEALPQGGTVVIRGKIKLKPGAHTFNMGYGNSSQNIFEINGKEVYRKEPGAKKAKQSAFTFEEEKSYPFKLTFLTKHASPLGWFMPTFVPGSLTSLVKVKKKYPFLINDQEDWVERDDVYFHDARTNKSSFLHPKSNGGMVGPELGFGHVIGDHINAPVLLIKSCIGNRSLGWDLLPPNSKQYEYKGKIYAGHKESPLSWDVGSKPKPINWYAGKQWDTDVPNAKKTLDLIPKFFPEANGYEIAGFVWWQGDKDRYNEGHATRYEKNLTHLIKALRKEFNAPKAKFVLATLGQTPKDGGENPNEKHIINAMFSVDGNNGKYPEFKGNVSTVYSHPLSKGGASNGHYDKNAETYVNVGLALGEAMKELLTK